MLYLVLKAAHIIGVVLFLGNIVTGIFGLGAPALKLTTRPPPTASPANGSSGTRGDRNPGLALSLMILKPFPSL
jgi:hypothetical protein